MAESERVGFEAYFETTEFLRGIDKFLKGLGEARSGIGNFLDAFGEGVSAFEEFTDEAASFDKRIGSTIGSIVGGLIGLAAGIPDIGASIGQMLGEITGGFGMFLNVLGPVGRAINFLRPAFRLAWGAASSLFSLIGTVGKAAFNILGSVASVALKGILLLVGSLAASVGSVLVGAFILLGRTVREVFSAIGQQIKNLLDSAITLQTIEVGLGAVTRAALVMDKSFENAFEAIGAAIPITDLLLDKLTEISLSSPFSVEDVNTLFRTIAAFGIALGTAVDLTDAMIDLGAATGFSNTILERIARNFSQVARNGKIFQRDIYELANAGVDLHAVLSTQLNVTVEEMNALLASGEMNVLDLIEALKGFASQYYGGAAEALSRTIQGLQTRFKTLGTVMVNDFARPLMNYVAPALETIFDGLSIVVQTGVFEKIGQMFANMGRTIVGNTNMTADTVAQTILKFILWLLEITNKMVQYGYDMMTQWGYGMLRGAADAITAVANFINRALTALFRTQSPPAILPLIDVWGAGLIEAWLEGMTHADFDVLGDIVSTVESVLKHLNIDEGVIYQQMQNVARMISESFEIGALDGGLLSYIENIAGPFGKAIAKFTSLQFDLAKAIGAVEIAQRALDDAFNMYNEADENVQKLVREYNALLRAGENDKVLDKKLKEINAEQDKREEAAKLIEKREEELEVAKINQEILEDQVNAQKELVSLMIKLTQPIKDAKDEMDKLGKSVADAAAELQNIWGGLGDLPIEEWDFSPAINSLLDEIDAMIAEIEKNFAKLWASFMSELGFEQQIINVELETPEDDKFGHLEKRWVKTGEGIFDGVGEALKQMAQTALNIDWGALDWSIFWNNLATALNTSLGGEGAGWDALKATLKQKLRDILGDAGVELSADYTIKEMFTEIGWNIAEGIFNGIVNHVKETASENAFFFMNLILGAIKSVFGIESSASEVATTEIGEPIGEGVLWGLLNNIETNITRTAQSAWDTMLFAFRLLLGMESPSTVAADEIGAPIAEGILEGLVDTISKKIATAASDIWTDISNEFNKFINSAAGIGRNILLGLLNGIADFSVVGGLATWAANIIEKIKQALQDASDQGSPSKLFAIEVGAPLAQGILVGMTDEMKNIKKDMFTAVNDLVNYQPTPTSSYTPSTINTNNVTYNMNMGGNVVRDDMDIALIIAANKQAIRQASYGV